MNKIIPDGLTPLTDHINQIRESILAMVPELMPRSQKVAVIIATDGIPSDSRENEQLASDNFIQALCSLEGLPVQIVVRLCTTDAKVVKFYSDLGRELQLSMEVLNDFHDEAQEVFVHNSWLNYALPIHRCREIGFHEELFHLLDERPLTKAELGEFCTLLFGKEHFRYAPDPCLDWMGFTNEVERMLSMEARQWNPLTHTMTPLLNLVRMDQIHGDFCACTVS
mmetsp:Transcript_51944/g.52349  ORF Transcript_51944/g.52349 Transcript_51944/m.52349 type:complete len:224 (+) Transcript_51944:2010-2681(+)